MITYSDSLVDVTSDDLQGGFFVGWPNPPSPLTHYHILTNSAAIVLARIADGTVVGFITAVCDGISCAYRGCINKLLHFMAITAQTWYLPS